MMRRGLTSITMRMTPTDIFHMPIPIPKPKPKPIPMPILIPILIPIPHLNNNKDEPCGDLPDAGNDADGGDGQAS